MGQGNDMLMQRNLNPTPTSTLSQTRIFSNTYVAIVISYFILCVQEN